MKDKNRNDIEAGDRVLVDADGWVSDKPFYAIVVQALEGECLIQGSTVLAKVYPGEILKVQP